MARFYRLIYSLLVIALILPAGAGQAAPQLQTLTTEEMAFALLETMTPEERVGQLFLVTFIGPEAGAGSETGSRIYDLIVNYHIGGVVLTSANDNFVGVDQTIPLASSLVDQLQRNEYAASQQNQTNPFNGEIFTPVYAPLFIGIAQNGDGYPYDQILNGLTPLPSQMSLGATWQPELARQAGEVLGKELSGLGFNLYLGPSLDVLEAPFSENGGDLGVQTFGGDPYWVGEMGKAYISGLHQGSNNKIVVVASHFPGYGGSDRLPEDEVATVRKSLEQLKQIELYPFFAVTGNAPDSLAQTDALLVSHIRYQGFQGNIRATTKPVSFDPQAFAQLITLPAFASWREAGGVMISDNLGSRAVRRFYDPSGEAFSGRFVARDAFLAGNDLLYLGDISSSSEDAQTAVTNTLEFFAQKYREDPAFAQRVDESVQRILTLKLRIYGDSFSLQEVLPEENILNELNKSSKVTFDIARQAATLISPTLEELDDEMPDPPGRNDQIVFITDARVYQQCSTCRQQYTISVNGLADAVIRLYSGSGQILPGNLTSYSYEDLQSMLDAGTGVLQIENDLRQADWIVFASGTVSPDWPPSQALRNFLGMRPDLYQQKNLIAFAMGAPYYLDATDISKLTAYYGLFSRSANFLDVAARLLFQELQPNGDLPVSVPGAGYDIIAVLSPDPSQVIPLYLDDQPSPTATETALPTPTPPVFRIGDTISVYTGVIVDYNGRAVPDGTVVQFIITLGGTAFQQIEAQTVQGVAGTALRVDQPGTLQIRAESDNAILSDVLIFDIPPENVTATPPPPTETPTPSPTATEQPTFTPTVTLTPTPTPTVEPPQAVVNFGDWLAALAVSAVVGAVSYLAISLRGGLRWGVRAGFLALIGGLSAYSYIAIGLPGSSSLIQNYALWGTMATSLLGSICGAAAAWIWRLSEAKSQSS
ncbi:MAG: hypothetical protein JW726_08650 [Anaerolineales bacterium]|nr:hypothetical protein [Anaerolineales bacterium]